MREAIEREHIHTHEFAGMTRDQIQSAAQARVQHYSKPSPEGTDRHYQMLRETWQWVVDLHKKAASDG